MWQSAECYSADWHYTEYDSCWVWLCWNAFLLCVILQTLSRISFWRMSFCCVSVCSVLLYWVSFQFSAILLSVILLMVILFICSTIIILCVNLAECNSAEGLFYLQSIIQTNFFMLCVSHQGIILLSVINVVCHLLSVVSWGLFCSYVLQFVILLNVIMLCHLLSVILLRVVLFACSTVCHSTECPYAVCYAVCYSAKCHTAEGCSVCMIYNLSFCWVSLMLRVIY